MEADIKNTEVKPLMIIKIGANFPRANSCPITTQTPAEKGSSKRINFIMPFILIHNGFAY